MSIKESIKMNKFLQELNKKILVDGKLFTIDGNILSVNNPASLNEVGKIVLCGRDQISDAISSANKAFDSWKNISALERKKLIEAWHKSIIRNIDLLAEILSTEQGKPFEEAKKEVMYGAIFVEWFASEASKISGSSFVGTRKDERIINNFEPIGVVGAITPWNFPSAMVARKIAPAIAAGCTVVLKPSELTPFSALALGRLAIDSGIPEGVINIVTADAEEFSDVICSDNRVKKISFTGSTRVGKILYAKSSNSLKKLSLELGGNAPFIVCEDADIEHSVTSLLAAKLRGAGQSCVSPNRIFIHRSIKEKFTKLLLEKATGFILGDGRNLDVNLGCLINNTACERVENLIKDATIKGAKILLGGSRAERFLNKSNIYEQTTSNHSFFDVTIIDRCSEDMKIFEEEIFAPVIALYDFSDYDKVIELANSTKYGLASYVFSSSSKLQNYITSRLDFGMVGVNKSVISNEVGAFSGRKESGFGVEGSSLGIYEFLQSKYECHQGY
jgi:succinate-semialdehyde dehydrogenase / glutarate-semialdehyde dehydrogenase